MQSGIRILGRLNQHRLSPSIYLLIDLTERGSAFLILIFFKLQILQN